MGHSAAFEAKIEELRERVVEGRRDGNYFYERPIGRQSATSAELHGESHVVMSSYSYAGLVGHHRIAERSSAALARYGSGTHGVRLLAGTTDEHLELEAAIAAFKRTEAAITFASGYTANLAAVVTLVGRRGTVICDALAHASIVDACRLARCQMKIFRHNDPADLARCLEQTTTALKLVAVDGVYSMDGDCADLPALLDVTRKHEAWIMVDEAHSIGVLGERGHGIEEHFGLDSDAVDIKMGTLSKAIPATGGYIAGTVGVVDALRHHARPYIFSGALTPPTAAAARAAFEILEAEPERMQRLHENAAWFQGRLRSYGFDLGRSTTAVVPVLASSEQQVFDMTRHCGNAGVFVAPVVFPAVAKSAPRLRLSVTASHTMDELQRAASVLLEAGATAGVIKKQAA